MVPLPTIPSRLLDVPGLTVASPEWEEWARESFVADPKGELFNQDHAHLNNATIGILLTSADHTSRQGFRQLGCCGMGEPTGDKWNAAQRRQQIRDWFGLVPTFLITLDAVYLSACHPLQACALVEHELYHAGQAKDHWGAPKRDRITGKPVFDIRPHDVEEFVGVARRYGAHSDDLKAMKAALLAEPKYSIDRMNGICGCGARIA